MLATKRKFHTLLDSLTKPNANNASTTSLSSATTSTSARGSNLPAHLERDPKKRRLDERPISTPARIRKVTAPGTASAAQQTQDEKSARSPPTYAPWDRAQFLARLETFRHVDRWDTKPARVNEVQWAKRGWRCVGRERVACVGGCGREVVIKLRRSEDEEAGNGVSGEDEERDDDWGLESGIDEALVDRYAEMIVTEHDEDCLWRRRGCDDSIYRLPLAQPSSAIAGLKARYASLVAISSDLPSNVSLPLEADGQIHALLRHLAPDLLLAKSTPSNPGEASSATAPETPAETTPQINTRAATLALCGWRADNSDPPLTSLATCDACFRRLGLWLFNPRPATSTSSNHENESSRHELEEPIISRLDPLAEHRPYCPWIDPASQNGSPSSNKQGSSTSRASVASDPSSDSSPKFPGWQILVRVLRSTQHFRGDDANTNQEARPATNTSVSTSNANTTTGESIGSEAEANASREERDRERWAKLKRLRKVFDVRKTVVAGRRMRRDAAAKTAKAGDK